MTWKGSGPSGASHRCWWLTAPGHLGPRRERDKGRYGLTERTIEERRKKREQETERDKARREEPRS